MNIAMIVALAANGLGVFVCGDNLPQFVREGVARVAQLGEHTVTVEGTCHVWGRHIYELNLRLRDVTLEDLDGETDSIDSNPAQLLPHPVLLGWDALSHTATLTVNARSESRSWRASDSGGAGDVVLGVEDVLDQPGAADFFAALSTEPGTLSWMEFKAGQNEHHVAARFAFGAADAAVLRAAVLQCRDVPPVDAR